MFVAFCKHCGKAGSGCGGGGGWVWGGAGVMREWTVEKEDVG